MMLYGFKRTSSGRHRSEFPLGSLDWDGKLVVNVRDRNLRESLKTYFQEAIWIPVPLGDQDKVMGHTWERLEAGDEEHFYEAVKRLHSRDMFVDLDS